MKPAHSEVRRLRLQLLDTWHVGSGHGEDRYIDASVERDANGLPYVPGRMLKGLLRDAASALELWGHWPEGTALRLFGGDSRRAEGLAQPGLVRVSNAVLPAAERKWLAGDGLDASLQRNALFTTRFQTAIDRDSGIAAEGSLRGIELVLPLLLESEIELGMPSVAPLPSDWDNISKLLPLVRALGAHKTRGDGRVCLSWIAQEGMA